MAGFVASTPTRLSQTRLSIDLVKHFKVRLFEIDCSSKSNTLLDVTRQVWVDVFYIL